MFGNLLTLFDQQERTLNRYRKVVAVINDWEPKIKPLSDAKLRAKTGEFKARLAQGETLEQILPEAYAVIREAARRTLQMRHFDVQLIAGIASTRAK